jgi:exodeoxyribonuclease VII small subunit
MLLEKKIKKLESLASDLESEDLNLDQAVKKYGDAIKVAEESFSLLKKSEKKITVLTLQGESLLAEEMPYEL